MKKLLRYYKNFMPFIIIGGALSVIGVLIWYYAWEIWALSYPIIAVGLVLLIFGLTMRVTDATYIGYFTSKVEQAKSGRRIEVAPDYTSGEFEFDGNTMAKIGSSQKPVSELYCDVEIYFEKTTMKLYVYRVNLLADSVDKAEYTFGLAEVTAASEDKELRVNGVLKKITLLTISDSTSSATFPVRYNDIGVDQLVEKINDAKTRL